MKIEYSMVEKMLIGGIQDFDTIAVYFEDLEPERGKVTITCHSDSWSNYWSAMGKNHNIRSFFLSADNDYIAKKLQSGIKRTIDDFEKLEDHAKKYICQRRYEGDLSRDQARELFDATDNLETIPDEDPTKYYELMYRIFGDEWWCSVPQQPNPKYQYLCEIIDIVKSAIRDTVV